MSKALRYDIVMGRCAICGGPVYLTQTVDIEGNKFQALQCWNGHYKTLKRIDLIYSELPLTKEEVEKIIPYIGFVRLDNPAKPDEKQEKDR